MGSRPPQPLQLEPDWLAHRYDEGHDAVHFVRSSRAERRAAPFLTDEHLARTEAPVVVARTAALAAAPEPAPVHFIFHSAYCCSTLLAAACDRPGVATSLKEPQILNDLVGWRHRGGVPERIGAVLGDVLRLLARPYAAGEAVVVKPSNVVNGLASAMLDQRPEARAVLLYAPLPAFLTSIARKGMWGRLWVRELYSRQLPEGLIAPLGFEQRDYLLHTDLQVAAAGWLAQQHLFAALCRRFAGRVATLDSEQLVAEPARALAAVAGLFGLTLDDAAIDEIRNEIFARNAKDGAEFAAGQRAADRAGGAALHGEEVEKVTAWAEAVAATAGIAMTLPAPLIA